MGKKTRVLFGLLIITIGLIILLRSIIKTDMQETQQARLYFFTQNLDIQKNYLIHSYESSASLIYNELSRNKRIQKILDRLKNTDKTSIENINQELSTSVNDFFREFNESGISTTRFHHNFTIIVKNMDASTSKNYFSYNPYDTDSIFPQQGFLCTQQFTGYKFAYPYYINKKQVAFIEIGFDIRSIQMQMKEINKSANIGYLITNNDSSSIQEIATNTHFKTIPFLSKHWINKEFTFPKEIKSEIGVQKQLKSKIEEAIHGKELNNFSIYLNTDKQASVITLSEVQSINKSNSIFLVSSNKDYLLTKTREINNAVFVINFIIIILVMLSVSYLIINRIHLIHEKENVQKSTEKLIELNQSKDKFFSIVAHDLKNPFNGIMGLSGYLSTEYNDVDDNEKKEIINDINIASKNAYNLLQNLLEWTKAQSGLIKNNPILIEPKRIIDLALETVRNLAKYKEIKIEEEYLTDTSGFADENLVSTVIRNLSTNAIKFSPRHSIIKITVNQHREELVFCIKDKGIGLSDDDIDQLFRIDVNFHKRGTEKETGSGLGLKLCKEFVEFCKGRIWVVSILGQGSSFYFTIPVYHE